MHADLQLSLTIANTFAIQMHAKLHKKANRNE